MEREYGYRGSKTAREDPPTIGATLTSAWHWAAAPHVSSAWYWAAAPHNLRRVALKTWPFTTTANCHSTFFSSFERRYAHAGVPGGLVGGLRAY